MTPRRRPAQHRRSQPAKGRVILPEDERRNRAGHHERPRTSAIRNEEDSAAASRSRRHERQRRGGRCDVREAGSPDFGAAAPQVVAARTSASWQRSAGASSSNNARTPDTVPSTLPTATQRRRRTARAARPSSLSHRLDARHDTVLQYPMCGSRASCALVSQQRRGGRAARRCLARLSLLGVVGRHCRSPRPACAVHTSSSRWRRLWAMPRRDDRRPGGGGGKRLKKLDVDRPPPFASALSLHRERSAAAPPSR